MSKEEVGLGCPHGGSTVSPVNDYTSYHTYEDVEYDKQIVNEARKQGEEEIEMRSLENRGGEGDEGDEYIEEEGALSSTTHSEGEIRSTEKTPPASSDLEEVSSMNSPDQASILTCFVTLLLYFVQVIPSILFSSVYPVLYGLRGYSEDDLSFLSLGSIPWCLKFLFGFLFESVWRPPRIFLALLQFFFAGVTLACFWIPVENVKLTAAMYWIYTLLVVAHDSIMDGQLIMVFAHHGALLNLLQAFQYPAAAVILSFAAVSNFNQWIFLITAIVCFVTIPLLWVYKWTRLPLVSLRNIGGDFLKIFWVIPICFIYFLFEYWSESMASYFAADIVIDEQRTANVVGTRYVGELVGIMFGQYLYFGLKYRNCIIIALVVETLGELFYIFLKPGSAYGGVVTLYLFAGLFASLSDSIVQCFKVDAAGLTRCPTWIYSVFDSFSEAATSIASAVWPQVKKVGSWRTFWGLDLAVCGVVAVAAAVCFYTLPFLRRDRALNSAPSLHWDKVCRRCATKASDSSRTDIAEKEDKEGGVAEKGQSQKSEVEVEVN